MQSTFLKRTIKTGLAKAGVSFSRSKHGVVIYLAGGRKQNIFHSALINADSFSYGEYQDSQHTSLIVDLSGLHINNGKGKDPSRAQADNNFTVSLSGVYIKASAGNEPDISWHWPDNLKNGVRTLVVSFKNSSGHVFSDNYLIDFRQDSQRLFGALYRDLITEPIMGTYMIGFGEKQCYIQGWIYDPDNRPEEENITLNGETPKLRFSKSQPEWEKHIGPVSSYFTMKGDQHFSFFEAELESTGETGQPIVFNYKTKSSSELNRCQGAYIEDDLPIPDGNIFKRVSGDENPFTFRYVGYSTFLKLEALCKKYLAEDFGKVDRILDWGCGCGRVSRYFSNYSSETEIHGIDIDPTGINWLNENLDFGNFVRIEPNSQTPFPDGHFNFIFGISIFTHLTEEDHFFWLKELQRIIAKNGIVAVTTGSTIMRARMFNVSIGDQVSDHLSGYSDQGYNAQIDGATDNDAYYRDTFITKEYIQTVWSEYFDILDVHSGLISCLQDMVIMRKKS